MLATIDIHYSLIVVLFHWMGIVFEIHFILFEEYFDWNSFDWHIHWGCIPKANHIWIDVCAHAIFFFFQLNYCSFVMVHWIHKYLQTKETFLINYIISVDLFSFSFESLLFLHSDDRFLVLKLKVTQSIYIVSFVVVVFNFYLFDILLSVVTNENSNYCCFKWALLENIRQNTMVL